jgi:hypothetical protein
VDQVQVDVVGAQPGERGIELFQDRQAGQSLTARAVCILPETFVATTISSRRE